MLHGHKVMHFKIKCLRKKVVHYPKFFDKTEHRERYLNANIETY